MAEFCKGVRAAPRAPFSLQRHRVHLVRASHRLVRYLRETYPDAVIGNHVDRGNEPARTFLQALGAVITRTPGQADCDFFFFPRTAAA